MKKNKSIKPVLTFRHFRMDGFRRLVQRMPSRRREVESRNHRGPQFPVGSDDLERSAVDSGSVPDGARAPRSPVVPDES